MPEQKKAFDLKNLATHLEQKGLSDLEACARDVVEAVLDWTVESVELTDNKLDDMILVAIPYMKKFIMDKIDEMSPPAPIPPAAAS